MSARARRTVAYRVPADWVEMIVARAIGAVISGGAAILGGPVLLRSRDRRRNVRHAWSSNSGSLAAPDQAETHAVSELADAGDLGDEPRPTPQFPRRIRRIRAPVDDAPRSNGTPAPVHQLAQQWHAAHWRCRNMVRICMNQLN